MHPLVRFADKIDRALTSRTLIALNVLIIIACELRSKPFFDTGAIHGIALLFVALAVLRLVDKYYVGDVQLKKFLRYTLVALLTLAFSHLVEFMSVVVLGEYEDAAFANVINMYGASLAFLAAGSAAVLADYRRKGSGVSSVFLIVASGFLTFAAVIVAGVMKISLEPESLVPYTYALVMFTIGGLAVIYIRKVGSIMPATKKFSDAVTVGALLILLASVPNIFYESFEERLGISKMQLILLSHFGFYAAVSFVYVAVGRFKRLGGVYDDVIHSLKAQEDREQQ